jgi:hypothetical protein
MVFGEIRIDRLSKTFDPRSGENTVRTTILSRSEPDPSLFQVLADYTIVAQWKEASGFHKTAFIGSIPASALTFPATQPSILIRFSRDFGP